MTWRLGIVASHVIQYQDPFFRLLAAEPEIDLEVLFFSRIGAVAYRDAEMSTSLRWDLDLLQGYRHRFLTNFGAGRGFFRHVNPSIVTAILGGRYDAVISMPGWGSLSTLLALAACLVSNTPFFFYGDSSFPPPEDSVFRRLRAGILRFLFRRATGFMVSGKLNADYYAHYGADRDRFFLLPWAVDNERFEQGSRFAPGEREAMRERYGIAPDDIAFVFSAKLIPRKDPLALLLALDSMRHRERAVAVYLGEGSMRGEIEARARELSLAHRVRLPGFINQSDLPKHYAMCDVFVLPSRVEPRGAVVNEAMACGLPVVVTDRCGSIGDIVIEGENALIYPAGDHRTLAECLDRLVESDDLRQRMGRRSRDIIRTWDYHRGVEGVVEMLRWVGSRRRT
ncbi:MAG TPA: glycosyltransferase family 4 protein [Thermoanaerobaculia bacterium]|nr:glycosyltransferase family 4 protein [Thermoanaerobaculia bacterium]